MISYHWAWIQYILFSLVTYAQILNNFEFLSMSYHFLSKSVWPIKLSKSITTLKINTKFSRLQVCNTCIARCNSMSDPFVFFCIIMLSQSTVIADWNNCGISYHQSCNWFWQFNWPHWLWEQMIGSAQKIKMIQNLGISYKTIYTSVF